MSQREILSLINNYNSTDRNIIKKNLKRVMKEKGFKSADVMELGFSKHNVYSWGNTRANNIPMVDQALTMGIKFGFDVKDLLKTI